MGVTTMRLIDMCGRQVSLDSLQGEVAPIPTPERWPAATPVIVLCKSELIQYEWVDMGQPVSISAFSDASLPVFEELGRKNKAGLFSLSPIALSGGLADSALMTLVQESAVTHFFNDCPALGLAAEHLLTPFEVYRALSYIESDRQPLCVLESLGQQSVLFVFKEGTLQYMKIMHDAFLKNPSAQTSLKTRLLQLEVSTICVLGDATQLSPMIESFLSLELSVLKNADILSAYSSELGSARIDDAESVLLLLAHTAFREKKARDKMQFMASRTSKKTISHFIYKKAHYVFLSILVAGVAVIFSLHFFAKHSDTHLEKTQSAEKKLSQAHKNLIDKLGSGFSIKNSLQVHAKNEALLLKKLESIYVPGVWVRKLSIKGQAISMIVSTDNVSVFERWRGQLLRLSLGTNWEVKAATNDALESVTVQTKKQTERDKKIKALKSLIRKASNFSRMYPLDKEKWLKEQKEAQKKLDIIQGSGPVFTQDALSKKTVSSFMLTGQLL